MSSPDRSHQEGVQVAWTIGQCEAASASLHLRNSPLGCGAIVVIDILRATSSITQAIASGCEGILPMTSVEQARAAHAQNPETLLAGERHGKPPEGFDFGNSPKDFAQAAGHRLVMTTTNGTRALQAAKQVGERSESEPPSVAIGSFLNLTSLCQWLAQQPKPWKLFCSGTGSHAALEDLAFASAICKQLEISHSITHLLSNTSLNADEVHTLISRAQNGRHLQSIGLKSDIWDCSQIDSAPCLPKLYEDGWIKS